MALLTGLPNRAQKPIPSGGRPSGSPEELRAYADQVAAAPLDCSPENHVAWPNHEAALGEVDKGVGRSCRKA